MSAQVADVLRKARALIEVPERWTVRLLARDRHGNPATAYSRESVCWCSLGAIIASDDGVNEIAARRALRGVIAGEPIGEWNDAPERTHAEVLAAFDRAIAAEEATP